jgi:Leucine-rich repeat (LRR) protein
LSYPDASTAEGRALQWLIDVDLGTTAPSSSSTNELSLRQRYALTALWFQTPTTPLGNPSHFATWANTSLNECEWHDVKCDNVGRVARLTLGGDNVRGRIPDDLGLLTALNLLQLYDNYLTGTIPWSVGASLTALEELYLNSNHLSGTIPSSLGALTTLTAVALYGNQLNGTIPSSLGNVTALVKLSLSSNRLTGTIPSSLGALTAVTGLWMTGNQLNGTIPSSLGALTALDGLFLWGNRLSGTIPSSLASLTALARLWLFNNQLVGTVPFCTILDQTTIQFLVMDCNKVSCPCCTECCPTDGWNGIEGFDQCDAR